MENRILYLGGPDIESSCYLLDINGYRIMVDCGVGFTRWSDNDPRAKEYGKKVRGPAFPPGLFEEKKIDAILLTHIHLDHSGYIPRLIADGVVEPWCAIWAHGVTHAGLSFTFRDTAKHSPYLYGEAAVEAALNRRAYFDEDRPYEVLPGIDVFPAEIGHLAGARMMLIRAKGSNECWGITGDMAFHDQPTIRGAAMLSQRVPYEFLPSQILGTDLTAGLSRRRDWKTESQNYCQALEETLERGGKVITPAFAFGRGQNMLFVIAEFLREKRASCPIFADGAIRRVAKIYERKLGLSLPEEVKFVRDEDHRKELVEASGPMVIVTTGGMGDGPVMRYFETTLPNEKDSVFFVGYVAENTTGAEILAAAKLPENEHKKIVLRENGNERTHVPICCSVKRFHLSGHCDIPEETFFFRDISVARGAKVRRIGLTHGVRDAKSVAAYMMRDIAENICFGELWTSLAI